jgi:hypothetical protein
MTFSTYAERGVVNAMATVPGNPGAVSSTSRWRLKFCLISFITATLLTW